MNSTLKEIKEEPCLCSDDGPCSRCAYIKGYEDCLKELRVLWGEE